MPYLDGTPVEESGKRNAAMQEMLARRAYSPPSDPYKFERL
jgi:hypothetical protein